jgi:phage-related protein
VTVPFTYNGTAETGFYVQVNVTANTPKLTLKNNNKTMVLTYPFLAGDVVYIDTNRGSRNITMVRSSVTYPLIAYLDVLSPWLELHSQTNTMSVYGTLSTDLVAGVKTLKYRASYWGV